MGRYYYGQISGKFWFAVQCSFDASQQISINRNLPSGKSLRMSMNTMGVAVVQMTPVIRLTVQIVTIRLKSI